MLFLWPGPRGFTVGFLLHHYAVVCTVESLSLFYPLFISRFYVLADDTSMR